jgi:putative NADH-flavin reductase
MNIALVGATGPVGKRILNELLLRGHRVTAIVRDTAKLPEADSLTAISAQIEDTAGFTAALRGHDAIIVSVRFLKIDPDHVIGAIKDSGVTRYLSVGGAASLYAPGTKVKLIDGGQIPAEFLPEPQAGVKFLARLEQEQELEWSFLSPPMMFSNDEQYGTKPGGRTGVFRVGKDELLVSETGESEISYEDYAVAMVDELENARHIRQRFTVGY